MSPASRIIVLTGVSRGCGRALTEEFIRLGHRVIGCGHSEREMAALQGRFPPPNYFGVVDVADDAQVAAWANRVLAVHTAPDRLLNNAGIINRSPPLWEVPASEFSGVVDVNLKGAANVIRHFAPAMIRRGRGVIVNSVPAGASGLMKFSILPKLTSGSWCRSRRSWILRRNWRRRKATQI